MRVRSSVSPGRLPAWASSVPIGSRCSHGIGLSWRSRMWQRCTWEPRRSPSTLPRRLAQSSMSCGTALLRRSSSSRRSSPGLNESLTRSPTWYRSRPSTRYPRRLDSASSARGVRSTRKTRSRCCTPRARPDDSRASNGDIAKQLRRSAGSTSCNPKPTASVTSQSGRSRTWRNAAPGTGARCCAARPAPCPDPAQLGATLLDARPTYLFGPPRLWQNLKAKLELD